MYKTILVPVDVAATDDVGASLSTAKDLAKASGGKIVLLPADSIQEYDFAGGTLRLKETPDQVQSAPEAAPGVPMTMPDPEDASAGHYHLVSQVLGYGVEAVNGPLGRIGDVLIDSEGMAARYIIVDTRECQPGSDKLVPTEWIDLIDWVRGRVFLKITREKARMCQRASAGSHVFY